MECNAPYSTSYYTEYQYIKQEKWSSGVENEKNVFCINLGANPYLLEDSLVSTRISRISQNAFGWLVQFHVGIVDDALISRTPSSLLSMRKLLATPSSSRFVKLASAVGTIGVINNLSAGFL